MAQPRAAAHPHGHSVRGGRDSHQRSAPSSLRPVSLRDLAPLRDPRPPWRESRASAAGHRAANGGGLGRSALRV
eukprot:8253021-Pyramimonas_sp.AAC.1